MPPPVPPAPCGERGPTRPGRLSGVAVAAGESRRMPLFRLFTRRRPARPGVLPASRPTLEALEDRTLPSTAGALDPTFGKGGEVVAHVTAQGDNAGTGVNRVVVQPDGKVVAAGVDGQGAVVIDRFNADGSADKTFNGTGQVTLSVGNLNNVNGCDLALAPGGKLVLVTNTGTALTGPDRILVARFNANGTPDTSFGVGGRTVISNGDTLLATGVAVQPDGKVVIVGDVTGRTFEVGLLVLRLTSGGQMDGTFGGAKTFTDGHGNSDHFVAGEVVTPSGYENEADAVALQGDGKIVVTGWRATAVGGAMQLTVTRFNANGGLDAAFGGGGSVLTSFGNLASEGASVAVQADGKIVVAGGAGVPNAPSSAAAFVLARYTANGSLDAAFGTGGKVLTNVNSPFGGAAGVAVQADGKVIAVGSAGVAGGGLDTGFGQGGKVTTAFPNLGSMGNSVALQPDGRIVVGGLAGSMDGSAVAFALARYLPGTVQPALDALSATNVVKALNGQGFQFTVTALDALGHTLTGFTGTVRVTSTNGNA